MVLRGRAQALPRYFVSVFEKRFKLQKSANTMTGDDCMNKVNCIRIFCILTVLFGIGCYQVMHLRNAQQEPDEAPVEQVVLEAKEAETEEAAVEVSGTIEYKFVILEEGDYLTVYLADRETVYEYTGIRYSQLDEEMQKKIRPGYCIKDEEALFGFLENYSS